MLWPSAEEPEPKAAPGHPAQLPSEGERRSGFAIKAQLRQSGHVERESLVVYAFTDRADLERVKPSPGTSNDDGAGYAARLTKELANVPLSRWSRSIAPYVIVGP